jgi:hypothetical protein
MNKSLSAAADCYGILQLSCRLGRKKERIHNPHHAVTSSTTRLEVPPVQERETLIGYRQTELSMITEKTYWWCRLYETT